VIIGLVPSHAGNASSQAADKQDSDKQANACDRVALCSVQDVYYTDDLDGHASGENLVHYFTSIVMVAPLRPLKSKSVTSSTIELNPLIVWTLLPALGQVAVTV
jgi:hypothetical protein